MQAEGMLRRELVRRIATALPGDPGTLTRRLAIAYLHARQIDHVPMVVDDGTVYAAAVGVLGLEAESAAILASAAGRGSTRA